MTSRTTSRADVTTDEPSRYLQQLCKHFAHKLPVEVSPEAGSIEFSIGTMRGRTETGRLVLTAEADDEERLAKLEDVIARHLVRFMFRAPPTIAWTRL
jgi:hypothetical protein